MTYLYVYIFLGLMAIGVPIVFVMLFAPALSFVLNDQTMYLTILPQRVFSGINQFPVLAVPLFMLAGEVMNQGEITGSLVRFANSVLGHIRGGLAHVNILSSILFAGLTGSAVADTSALGGIFFPAMEKEGFTPRFSAAVTAASSIIGPIIPPSLIMILYAFVMEVSVAAMFAGGFIPGLLMGGALMFTTAILSRKKNFPKREKRAPIKEIGTNFKSAFLPMLTPVIILGGILAGIFTPTEAAGVAVFYALGLTMLVTRTLKPKELPDVFFRAAKSAASVLLVVGAAVAFGWIATVTRLPHMMGAWVAGLDMPVWAVFFFVNCVLLLVGMFLDAAPAILIMGPILGPVMINLGVDPVHFAVVMCVIVTVGLTTPPMGVVLFLAASMTKTKVEVLSKELAPFLLTHLVVIFIVTYVPELVLWLPRLMGLK